MPQYLIRNPGTARRVVYNGVMPLAFDPGEERMEELDEGTAGRLMALSRRNDSGGEKQRELILRKVDGGSKTDSGQQQRKSA
jgi:hypothetical protein